MLSTCSEGEKHCGGARSRIQPGDVGFDRSRSVSDGASVDDCEELDSASSVIVVFIAGCASEDRPLRDWNLDVDGGPQKRRGAIAGEPDRQAPASGDAVYVARRTLARTE